MPANQVEGKARTWRDALRPRGCEPGHHGEDVSINSILKKYNLTDPALVLLGELSAPPTSPLESPPGRRRVARSRWLHALGLSDHEILDREFIV